MIDSFVLPLLKIVIVLNATLVGVTYMVLLERKVIAWAQSRLGPMRVGPYGILQPVADAVKFILKEDLTPAHVNKFYYWLAPCLSMVPAIMTLAVIPFGSTLFGVKMVIADVNIGALFVFAIASLGVYGIVIAGYASNSKYPFLGGVRSSSQMISYELALGLSVVPIFLICGTINLSQIVDWQIKNGWLIFPIPVVGGVQFDWWRLALIPLMGISFVIFLVSMFAETNRTPFDLPEAEQELVGGYHTEYSSMGFALFFLGEYAAMIAGSGVIVTLFFGGWSLPWIPDGASHWLFGLESHVWSWLPGAFWGFVNINVFFAKVSVLIFFFIWVRWTVPRFRYDQVMQLGWQKLLPLAIANLLAYAIGIAFVQK